MFKFCFPQQILHSTESLNFTSETKSYVTVVLESCWIWTSSVERLAIARRLKLAYFHPEIRQQSGQPVFGGSLPPLKIKSIFWGEWLP